MWAQSLSSLTEVKVETGGGGGLGGKRERGRGDKWEQ